MRLEYDFLVIGSGVAGLSFARVAAQYGRVAVLTKRGAEETSTSQAQGGIASVLDKSDSFELHVEDSLVAGAGQCRENAVRVTVEEGPQRLLELAALGCHFDVKSDGRYDLTREGGHSRRRIVHAGDITGKEVQRALLKHCRSLPQISFFEHSCAIDLVCDKRLPLGQGRCLGAYVLMEGGHIEAFHARQTVLATGGSGKAYLYTSNPDVATGDGLAMAFRAGARIANMEFFQFHPTCLFHPEAKNFLLSEAVRGEGGILRLRSGQSFMQNYHHQGDLAPRDVVTRAMDTEMKKSGDTHLLLDVRHLGQTFLKERFPNLLATCRSFGVDMVTTPIPVVPAAHYQCGGIDTDLDGHSTLPGLFAVGEVAHTGLHGANRLASNSLLEGLVFGHRAAMAAVAALQETQPGFEPIAPWIYKGKPDSFEGVLVRQNWEDIRRLMWNLVGIVRSDKRLLLAKRRLKWLREEIRAFYGEYVVTRDMLELRNIADVAYLIVECALLRKESRGLHTSQDWPNTLPSPQPDSFVQREP
ncbi:MAG: L-aspartate oxidase [Cystobacterineae bacterium]|nr:L-aspartate oxidase [Cystobacterineae bacterium]